MNADEYQAFYDAINEELMCEFATDCDDLKVDAAELLGFQAQPPHLVAWLLAEKHNLRPKGGF
jgi:hypothetical protein